MKSGILSQSVVGVAEHLLPVEKELLLFRCENYLNLQGKISGPSFHLMSELLLLNTSHSKEETPQWNFISLGGNWKLGATGEGWKSLQCFHYCWQRSAQAEHLELRLRGADSHPSNLILWYKPLQCTLKVVVGWSQQNLIYEKQRSKFKFQEFLLSLRSSLWKSC